jgi:hypothetical protein
MRLATVPAMGFQWNEDETRAWLYKELDQACASVKENADDAQHAAHHRGRVDALIRVMWHIFDDGDSDALNKYAAQRMN